MMTTFAIILGIAIAGANILAAHINITSCKVICHKKHIRPLLHIILTFAAVGFVVSLYLLYGIYLADVVDTNKIHVFNEVSNAFNHRAVL